MKVCVLGDSGLVGQELVQQLLLHGDEVLGISSSAFQPTPFWRTSAQRYRHLALELPSHENAFLKEMTAFKPALIVNCVAIVDLALCEREPQRAHAVNAKIAEIAASASVAVGAGMIHISTDQVFNGLSQKSYSENDAIDPVNVYGRTKLEAEQLVLAKNPHALVARTNVVGFRDLPKAATFAEWLCNALSREEPITLFTDYVTSSIHVEDLVSLVLAAHAKGVSGVLHVATKDRASKQEFGLALAQSLATPTKQIASGSIKSLGGLKRPPMLGLNTERLEKLGLGPVPTTADTVKKLARDYLRRKA